MLMRIFQRLGVSVSETGAVTESLIAVSRNGIKVNGRGHAHISFEEIGSNSAVELAQAVRDVQSLGAISIQLSARLQDPGVAGFTQAARELGFFFCGLGPAFGGDSDLILLQRLGEPLDIGKLQLFTDEAKELVAFVDADRASVGASGR